MGVLVLGVYRYIGFAPVHDDAQIRTNVEQLSSVGTDNTDLAGKDGALSLLDDTSSGLQYATNVKHLM